MILLLAYCCSTLESTACFFLSNIIPVFHSNKRRKGRQNCNKTFVIITDHTFDKIKEDTGRETKDLPEPVAGEIHLSRLRTL